MQLLDYILETPKHDNDRIVVQTEKLSKRFKKSFAVKDVTFKVCAGDVFGLLGPNGAGKTTIIRMLLGLISPSSGEAKVFGYNPKNQRAQVLQRVSAIVEAPALYPALTGLENMQLMARLAGIENPRKVREVLNKMGLTKRAEDKFRTYSLGMKQRLCIAAALLTDPQLIILDEPTNGLDPAGMAEIRFLIKELADQGRTVFLSSHLLHEVQQVCNRVAVIQGGQIISQGLVSDLLAGKSLIQVKVPLRDVEKAFQVLRNEGWGDRLQIEKGSLNVDGPASQGFEINQILAQHGIYAGEIAHHTQTLEDFYLSLTTEKIPA